jgi:gamma-glutamylcyclotransferase (GGCT)/AIG2-like uncharacterized protein YtfP
VNTRLLVYGLLRRGEPMHGLLGDAVFLGEVRLPGFDLFHMGEYPAAVPGTGTIVAELYEIRVSLLEVLDRAERVPTLYRREIQEGAWLYVFAGAVGGAPRIASGDWLRPPGPPSIP